jgi:hypothetical protein
MISKIKSYNISIRFFSFKAWPRAQIILLYIDELQSQTCQRHHKYQQGKKIVRMLWEKQQVSQRRIPKEINKFVISSILHMWAYWGIDIQ